MLGALGAWLNSECYEWLVYLCSESFDVMNSCSSLWIFAFLVPWKPPSSVTIVITYKCNIKVSVSMFHLVPFTLLRTNVLLWFAENDLNFIAMEYILGWKAHRKMYLNVHCAWNALLAIRNQRDLRLFRCVSKCASPHTISNCFFHDAWYQNHNEVKHKAFN